MKKIFALMFSFIIATSLSNTNFVFAEENSLDSDLTVQSENDYTANADNSLLKESQLNKVFNVSNKTSELTTRIIFGYEKNLDILKRKNITISILNNTDQVIGTFVFNTEGNVTLGSYNSFVKFTQNDNFIEASIKIEKLPVGTYKIKLTGDGYQPITTDAIDITSYTKEVVIGTSSGTFNIGDLNLDGVVDAKDKDIIQQNLNKYTKDLKYDLNADGILDIADIVFINRVINSNGKPLVYDVKANVVAKNVTSNASGDLNDIFTPGTEVKLTSNTDISEEKPFVIESEFEKPIETEEIHLTNTSINGGTVVVTKENGETIEVNINQAATFRSLARTASLDLMLASRGARNNGNVVIPLGQKVPVKKITIKVTEVENADGTKSYLTVEEVQFLKDIVPENPLTETIVTKVQVDTESEKIILKWKPLPNVSGYKIKYGEKSGAYTQELQVDKNSAIIEGLENLKPYYFVIIATSPSSDGSTWEGKPSAEIVATPQPDSAPGAPDNVAIAEGDSMLTVSWKKTDNAIAYNVYLREVPKNEPENAPINEADFTLKAENIKQNRLDIAGLTNDTKYQIFVKAKNNIGVGPRSIVQIGIPVESKLPQVTPPTKNKISRDSILSAELDPDIRNGVDHSYNPNLYPDGVKGEWMIDGDYKTSWVARDYFYKNSFTFTFKEPHTMNQLVVVPRLDDNKYGDSLSDSGHFPITIKAWKQGESEPTVITRVDGVNNAKISYIEKEDGKHNRYFVISFPKQENVTKINVKLSIWNGAPKNANASEFIFYDYDTIYDDIEKLFTDSTFTQLKTDVTESQINNLIEQVNNATNSKDTYLVDSSILLQELTFAKELLANNTSNMGIIKQGLDSRSASINSNKYGVGLSDLQPIGLSAKAGSKIVIYAKIPQGESVQLVPSQYYAEFNKMTASAITLQNGRNVITIPNITQNNVAKGGPLYLKYSGQKGNEIKLHIKGNYAQKELVKIPYLEIANWSSLNQSERNEKIKQYINELTTYVPSLTSSDKETDIFNATEISMPNVLLSLPADQILAGIQEGLNAENDKIQRVYNNILAWEEVSKIANTIYGLDNPNSDFETRQNIRNMRMFDGAFMYAAGNHIGVGYNSSKGLITGEAASVTFDKDSKATKNKLFGWGIAHEIGHNLDKLGKAEVTNNIYSLMMQTYDGKQNTLQSRFEIDNDGAYEKAFNKVAAGRVGESNDGKVSLIMYWQLHLAYDDGLNPMDFYNKVYKKVRAGEHANLSRLERFAVISSEVANKNLTEFFTRWGVQLSEQAKALMASKSAETRKIYYLNDDSRRLRLNKNIQPITNADIRMNASVNSSNSKQVDLTITTTTDNIFGYEIIRNNKPIAFIKNNSSKSVVYNDIIGSANNMAFSYKVLPVDVLGNPLAEVNADKEIRIEYDQTIDPSVYKKTFDNGTLTVTMNSEQTISGIVITPKSNQNISSLSGNIKVEIKATENAPSRTNNGFVIAKQGSFSETNVAKDKAKKYLTYFNKVGSNNQDTRIWTFDASVVKITGLPQNFEDNFDIKFIQYPGDNISFDTHVSGRLAKDYVYSGGKIKAGTLIVTGSYRGNPVYNTLQIVGNFDQVNSKTGEIYNVERAIPGEVLFFANELQEGEEYSTISDGFFIFIPNVQAEEHLQESAGSNCSHVSVLPKQIKAKLYRTDTPNDLSNKRLTSDTLWTDTPSAESMPTIEFK